MGEAGRGALVAPASLPLGATRKANAPLSLPDRRRPSHNSVHIGFDNRSVILFVTVCAKDRRAIFATPAAAECIVNAWKTNCEWIVGQYMIMPDHVHFCCALGSLPMQDFHRWMAKWKAHVSRTFPHGEGRACRAQKDEYGCDENGECGRDERVPPVGCDERIPPVECDGEGRACRARISPLWQRGCWDVQLRQGESFAAKCEYIRNNPVRAGLVANADEWPYQGRLNNLMWHDKV